MYTNSIALDVEGLLQPTGTGTENIVLMSAISAPGSKAVKSVDNEQFEREKLYQATMNMFHAMLEKGIITEEQYNVIDKKMLQKYRPLLGGLFSENACNFASLE